MDERRGRLTGAKLTPAHLQLPKYRITCQCLRCNTVYKRVVAKIPKKDPPCPKKACRDAQAAEERALMERNIREMIESEKAPGITGSNTAKAIDLTADIVQKDYGLTDLKDNVRQGETATPKLCVAQQEKVDNFWGAPKKPNPLVAQQMQLAGARALAGSYRPTEPTIVDYALSQEHGPELKPKIRIVAG